MPENAASWRDEAIKHLTYLNFQGNVYIPEYRDNKQPEDWTYSRQLDWEISNLNKATIILVWIPRELTYLPAFTTNIEFGEFLHSGRLIAGGPDDAVKNEYIRERCIRKGIGWFNNLKTLCELAVNNITVKTKPVPKVWFTSDTHFGEDRTRELSKRPFSSVSDMDWELIKRWNMKVSDIDTVDHLGDFGNPDMLKYLKCKELILVPGNYDKPEVLEQLSKDSRVHIGKRSGIKETNLLAPIGLYMMHEPIGMKECDNATWFYLFGHVHKLSMIKKQALNVGVDCHNFAPVSLEEVKFYINAVWNHYDENVFYGGKE